MEFDPTRTSFEVLTDPRAEAYKAAASHVPGAQVVTEVEGGGTFYKRNGERIVVPEGHQRVRLQVNEPEDFNDLHARAQQAGS